MNYSLAISPDLRIDAEEFSAVWNQDPASRDIARAESTGTSPEKYISLDPELVRQGMVFLAGVASTLAMEVVKDLIKNRIMKILAARSSSNASPPFEIIVVQPGDKPLIVVKVKAENS